MRIFTKILWAVIVLSSPLWARVITFDDLYSIPQFGDIRISPDGKDIVFTLSMRNAAANTSFTQIFVMDASGGEPRRLTSGDPRTGTVTRRRRFTAHTGRIVERRCGERQTSYKQHKHG